MLGRCQTVALAALVTLLACTTPPEAPVETAERPATAAQALAAGGRRLDAPELTSQLRGRPCSGERAEGLFEVEFAPSGAGWLTPPDGRTRTLAWQVDAAGELCSDLAGGPSCEQVILLDAALHLFDSAERHSATLVCS